MVVSRPVYWVNSFTSDPFTGNPAVVVPEAFDLSEDQMQRIAREMNCSETAFILRPTDTEADLRLRWFTPTQEVPLCGHATVAAMHILASAGQFNIRPGMKQILLVETLTGVLGITVDFVKSEVPWIWLTLPHCSFQALDPVIVGQVESAFVGFPNQFQAAVVDSLNRDLLLQVESLADLHQLSPNFEALCSLGKQHQWRGFLVFTAETLEASHGAQCRFFAPQFGISEDPVTGSASGPLGLFLKQQGLLEGDRLMIEQGHCLQRPGLIHVDLTAETPRCGGQAVTVLTGVLHV